MFEFFEKLRKKTEKEKRFYSFLIAFVFSGTILGFWSLSVLPEIRDQKKLVDKVKKVESGPTESFTSNFSGAFAQIKDSFSNLGNAISALGTPTDYYKATTSATSTTATSTNTYKKPIDLFGTTTEETEVKTEVKEEAATPFGGM